MRSARRWFVVVGVCLAAAVATAPSVDAQEEAKRSKPTLKPADANDDGNITRVEWTKFSQGFRKFDVNKNNAVDLAELRAASEPPQPADSEPITLAPVDFDGDGSVTRAEWTSLAGSFKQVDVDGNNVLNLAEFQAVVEARKTAIKENDSLALRAGLWRGAIVERRGENPNTGTPIELIIAGNQIAGRDTRKKGNDPNLGTGTFVAAGKPNVGYLDAQYSDGRVCLGIFEMRGDTLYWCVSNRGQDRPDDFITANGFWLMILKRIPDAQATQ